tara:strand:- start:1333 stop:1515 length:183 start_codon:yes stop_codon:yes gene_type:complete
MNTELIQHYGRMIDLHTADIKKIESTIANRKLCQRIQQRGLIVCHQGIINNLETKINLLK